MIIPIYPTIQSQAECNIKLIFKRSTPGLNSYISIYIYIYIYIQVMKK